MGGRLALFALGLALVGGAFMSDVASGRWTRAAIIVLGIGLLAAAIFT